MIAFCNDRIFFVLLVRQQTSRLLTVTAACSNVEATRVDRKEAIFRFLVRMPTQGCRLLMSDMLVEYKAIVTTYRYRDNFLTVLRQQKLLLFFFFFFFLTEVSIGGVLCLWQSLQSIALTL